jgi:hypothetical protein
MCKKKAQSLRALFDRACSMGETMVWVAQDKCLECLDTGEEGCDDCTDGWGAMSYTDGRQETDVPCYWHLPTSELVKYFYDGYSDGWGAEMPLRFVEMLMEQHDNALYATEQFDMLLKRFAKCLDSGFHSPEAANQLALF